MKVAITAQGKDLQSPVDLRFGRASWFILVDLDTGEYQAIRNDQNVGLAQGAGIQSAGNVAGHAPAYLITGHCGPKAFRALTAAGIKVALGAEGTVSEALDKFRRGELRIAEGPDVESHWG
jgi:predicted Fe-Mo cluster-binding NifX family protein